MWGGGAEGLGRQGGPWEGHSGVAGLARPGPSRAPQGRPVPSRVTGPQGPWGPCAPGADPSLPQRARIRKGPRHLKQHRARSACEQRACLCPPKNASRRARETETGRTAGGAQAASGVTDSPPPLPGAVWLPGAQTQQTVPATGAGCSCGGGPGTAVCRDRLPALRYRTVDTGGPGRGRAAVSYLAGGRRPGRRGVWRRTRGQTGPTLPPAGDRHTADGRAGQPCPATGSQSPRAPTAVGTPCVQVGGVR